MPLAGEPVLAHVLRQLQRGGITDVVRAAAQAFTLHGPTWPPVPSSPAEPSPSF
jgi:hypothetical protein